MTNKEEIEALKKRISELENKQVIYIPIYQYVYVQPQPYYNPRPYYQQITCGGSSNNYQLSGGNY